MIELVEANWPFLLAALLIGIAVAWFAFQASRKTHVDGDTRDVLDEGAAPAARNQALINSAPTRTPEAAPTTVSPMAPTGLAGAGAAVRAAAAEPVRQAAPASSGTDGDDLTLLKGVGPKLAAQLRDLGVTNFAQIAAWNDADIDRIDAQLGRFQGRIRRDNWTEQAGYFAKGDMEGFKARFGNIN